MSSSRTLTVTLVALLLIWGVGVASTQAADDTWISSKIRMSILTTDGAGGNAVKVDVEHGKVTLHGTVDSQAVKEKAEATARAVGGVMEVKNLLKADKSLDGIKVKSVENGLVFLDGSASSLTVALRAIEGVYGIPGVRQVSSGIQAKEQ